MKNHELLDMLGEVNGDYVLAADSNVERPRFSWKALAACAACAVLALCAYQVWWAAQPYQPLADYDPSPAPEAAQDPTRTLIQAPGLHDYILVEQDARIATTQGDAGIPGGIANDSQPDPAPGGGFHGEHTASPSGQDGDASVSEDAAAQYDSLLLWMLGAGRLEPSPNYPEWFGGAWLDNTARLTVAIVDGFRTPGLETQITSACGGTGEVLFTGVKYSQAYLEGLMDGITRIFEAQNVQISSAYGVYVMDNYLGLDFYGEAPSDETLSALADLDPSGDAIRIQVFCSGRILPTAQSGKDPAPGESLSEPMEPIESPVPNEERAEPALDPEASPTPIDGSDEPAEVRTAPGGPAGALPARTEDGHDIPGAARELPQAKYNEI